MSTGDGGPPGTGPKGRPTAGRRNVADDTHRGSGHPLARWLAVTFYCALIWWQSSRPSPTGLPAFPGSDKLLHFGAYALLSVLFYRAWESLPVAVSPRMLCFLAFASSALYGLTDEGHQYFVAVRQADLFDALADVAGSACGAWAYGRRSPPVRG